MNRIPCFFSRRTRRVSPRDQGFSLVEVMIALMIGMIALLIIMQVFSLYEGYKRTTGSGSDAQTNGLLAINTLAGKVRMAGYGVWGRGGDPTGTGGAPYLGGALLDVPSRGGLFCPQGIRQYDRGPVGGHPSVQIVAASANAAPVRIIDASNVSTQVVTPNPNYADTASNSDVLILSLGAGSMGAFPYFLNQSLSSFTTPVRLNTTAGMNPGDLVVFVQREKTNPEQASSDVNCALAQISSLDTDGKNFSLASDTSYPYNPPTGDTTLFPTGGFGANDLVLNLGPATGAQVQYRVRKVANTQSYFLTSNVLGGAAAVASDEVGNVVGIRAQYGIAAANGTGIGCWTSAVANPSGTCSGEDWSNLSSSVSATNYLGRIRAIRLAVLVRSPLMERDEVTNTNTISAWSGGPNFDISGITDAKKYRYRVYQTVIPLFNVLHAKP